MLKARGVDGKFLSGDRDMLAQLKKLAGRVPSTAAAALFLEGERVMREAKDKFTPVGDDRGGTLRDSGKTDPTARGREVEGSDKHGAGPNDWVVRLSFGGGAQAYAEAVHEHLSSISPYTWRAAEAAGRPVRFRLPGTGPKYLEKPLEAARVGLNERIAEKVRLVWEGGK